LDRHPPCAGPVRADGGGRISVKSTPGRNHRRHPSYSAGRAESGRNALAAMAHRAAHPHLDHSRRDRCVCARGLPCALPLSDATADRHWLHPGICLSAAAVGGWLHAGLGDDSAATGPLLKERAGLEQRRREQLVLPIGLLLKFAVVVLSVPLILLQWGYRWPDIYDWYSQLFFGFQIGNTQVSFAVLLASIIVFGLAYGAARLFQSWLDARILKPAGISGGVRDSIRIGVGYVGIVIAALAAFSYAGFNLSNLAILAGAFSVGIGFGLQSVVNNFVSGLILLAERPIKVGDLVVVGGEEGYVRKISVRSTEVGTSERARVLIPNSYFITEKVKNWTLRDNTRRVVIPISVGYGCDPRKVMATLLKVAQDNPNVMTTPAPSVDFDFGADSLNFKLYAFVY